MKHDVWNLFKIIRRVEVGRAQIHGCWGQFIVATPTRTGLGQSQEPGSSSRFPTSAAGVHLFGTSSAAFPGALAGSWMISRAASTQTRILIWEASTGGIGLTCYASPNSIFKESVAFS